MLEPGRRNEGDLLDLPNFHDDEEFDDEMLEPQRPWWRRPKGTAVIAGGVILALLVGSFAFIHSRRTPITYQYAPVTSGGLVTTVSATGPIQSPLYDVNFSGTGTIAQIDVKLGQQVKVGQVLAKLTATSLQDALNQAEIQADNAYISEQQALANCNAEAEKGNEPFGCVQSAENQYALALQALQTAEDNLANEMLKAPHAGTIVAINGVVGGTPGTSDTTSASSSGSGSSTGSGTFIEIADLSSLQVVADVNEADIGSVAVNQPVTFTVSAYSNRIFRGTITTISPIGESSSNVVTFPVTVTVASGGSTFGTGSNAASVAASASTPLLPGMTASVTIITAQRTGVLLLPETATTFARTAIANGLLTRTQEATALTQGRQMLNSLLSSNPSAEQDKPTSTLVVERVGGKWVAKPVVLGLSNGTSYEVLAGLTSGEQIVIGETGGNITPVASSSGTGRGSFFGGGGGFGGGRGGGGGGG